jgi:hypothetical protein
MGHRSTYLESPDNENEVLQWVEMYLSSDVDKNDYFDAGG